MTSANDAVGSMPPLGVKMPTTTATDFAIERFQHINLPQHASSPLLATSERSSANSSSGSRAHSGMAY